jgi:hypothetical protein
VTELVIIAASCYVLVAVIFCILFANCTEIGFALRIYNMD